ncbi:MULTISPECIES: TRAP transporter permease [Rhodomicrobium]|uniref:TRAP transporter permease n=1 Tax=Rhodomicrobium TaxID=1068 RepID=UPI001FD98D04|nr:MULTISPECIES: TRAP transporter permease [Rhodomicrobium]
MNFRVPTQDFSRRLAAAVALAMALYHICVIIPPMDFISPSLREVFRGPPTDYIFRGIHLLFALVLSFLWFRLKSATDNELAMLLPEERAALERKTRDATLLDYALVAASIVAVGYIFVYYDYIINRIIYVDDMAAADKVLSVTLILLVLEATRRVLGPALPLTAIAFMAYAALGTHIEADRFIDQLYLSTEGIFGQPLAVSASYVMIFVLFGAFMERTGTGQLFMDFAMALTGHTAGGPGKVSVVSSSLFGTISGSAVANVMVDGPISIPLMKRTGFKPHFAAAVEAVASTGGQIMPPIMGAAAFVMAEFQGVSYAQVVIWATIPAILYYIACFAAVHFEAKRQGLLGVPRSELPRLGTTMAARGHLFIPVLSILFVMYSGYSAPLAALTGTLLCFPVAWFGPVVLVIVPALILLPAVSSVPALIPALFGLPPLAEAALFTGLIALWLWRVRDTIILLKIEGRPIVDALIDGARNTLPVALACACAGIIIGIVILTGLGITFSQWVVGLSQDTLIVALVMTMAAGIVLGMGMPTTPAYIIMVSLLVPALVKLGVVRPAAHMFAFYFAILSAITPPVALAVYAASGLAKSNLWRTGWAAVKIGAAGFVVPFMFVYEPALLMIGDWPNIVWRFLVSCIGIGMLAAGLHGYLLTPMPYWQRAIAIIAALLLVAPELTTDIIGFALMSLMIAVQYQGQEPGKLASAGAADRTPNLRI